MPQAIHFPTVDRYSFCVPTESFLATGTTGGAELAEIDATACSNKSKEMQQVVRTAEGKGPEAGEL
jgi:hypothetical protein